MPFFADEQVSTMQGVAAQAVMQPGGSVGAVQVTAVVWAAKTVVAGLVRCSKTALLNLTGITLTNVAILSRLSSLLRRGPLSRIGGLLGKVSVTTMPNSAVLYAFS